MVKKNKNRHSQESPAIQNGGDSAESGDQKKTCSTGCRCTHIQKAVQLASIKKSLKNGCLASDCPGCIKDGVKSDGEESAPSAGLWLCLQCGHQGCGRAEKQHALKHFQVVHSDPHCIAVNTSSWSVWCYSCEVELPSEYRKKLHECVKYLKNVDCPSSARLSTKASGGEGAKEGENAEGGAMPLSDVTNMPHGVRGGAPKKKVVGLPRVRGLQNLGNTCFFNSVMQCLAHSPHLLELLHEARQGGARFVLPGGRGLLPKTEGEDQEEEEEELPALEGALTKWGTLTEALALTLEELRQDDAAMLNPQRLFSKLTAKCPQFAGGDQHDAHELLRHLLDEVRTEDLKRYWVAILDQYGLSRHDTSETVEESVRARVRAYGRQAGELWLLPDPVFRGVLVSTVECQDCLHSYQRTEPFYELSLPVSTNKPQPPVMRRKAGGDDSFDVCGQVAGDTPSKHQLKKERRQQRKGRKKHPLQQQAPQHKGARTSSDTAQEAHNTAESEQSDADVEDNVEQEVTPKEVRNAERLVNGGDVPSIQLCNGHYSDNEIVEGERTLMEENDANRTVDSGDLVCHDEKLCNGKETEPGDGIASSIDSQRALHEVKGTEDVGMPLTGGGEVAEIVEEGEVKEGEGTDEETDLQVDVSLKSVEGVVNGYIKEEKCVNKLAAESDTCVNGHRQENGWKLEECEDSRNGEVYDKETVMDIGICSGHVRSTGNENIELMDMSNDSTFVLTKGTPSKDMANEELSLTLSAAGYSPSMLSQTGSPGSVSSEATALAPLGSWPEEEERPFSRIAFCDAGGAEGLAKEMAGLSLGQQRRRRQSPSHWDTCSAHSLEDGKEPKHAGPALDAAHDAGDKSSTLAPRYHCSDKECSIESCLNQFTLLELMTGSCKVICESCSERINKGKEGKMIATNSTKQYLVSNPPAVLVLHLKRFEVHQNMFRKTPRHVTFPLLLDIAPICNAKCRELPTIRRGQTKVLYSLYGVVQHSGTLHGGHYSAYVKVRAPVKREDVRWCFLPSTPSSERLEEMSQGAGVPADPVPPGKWYHVSDSRVNEVNEDRVLHSQAYLLFYERVW